MGARVLIDRASDAALAAGDLQDDGATLLIIERDLGPANELPGPKFSDLNMLVGLGGQERTVDEYARLMRQAGLRFIANTPGAFDLHIIEAAPA